MRPVKIALVGRPNVGKSALFNALARRRLSIVHEEEGVTRDRLYAEADFFGKPLTLIDTGGINPHAKGDFTEEIVEQAVCAIQEADALIMVADVTVGVHPLDEEVARRLLRTKKPVVLAANKVDDLNLEPGVGIFYSLGISKVVSTSATHGLHLAELLEAALEGVELPEEGALPQERVRVALIGRPNVGKSTLMNHLLEEKRCVVSPVAGTTRDSIDVEFTFADQPFTLIDTAGVRKKRSEHEVVDKFAALRTERAMRRADVCVLILDAKEGMTQQEKRIARRIEELGKGCVLLFNKWDLVKGFRMEHCLKEIREEVPFVSHCPTIMISALTGRNTEMILPAVQGVYSELSRRIPTGELNRFLEKSMQRVHPPMVTGKRLRIYYMVQVATRPPYFVFFVNYPDLMVDSYKKYLINQFRTFYHFTGTPLKFDLRGKQREEEKS